MGRMSFYDSNISVKALILTVGWSHPFFVHNHTPDVRGVDHFSSWFFTAADTNITTFKASSDICIEAAHTSTSNHTLILFLSLLT